MDNSKYRQWHNEHLKWEWKKSEDTNECKLGRKIIIHEKIGEIDFKFTGKLVKNIVNEFLEFRHNFLPLSFSIALNDFDMGTNVTWKMHVGFSGAMGKILDPVLRYFFFTESKTHLIYRHIAEEHQLLEKLIV